MVSIGIELSLNNFRIFRFIIDMPGFKLIFDFKLKFRFKLLFTLLS